MSKGMQRCEGWMSARLGGLRWWGALLVCAAGTVWGAGVLAATWAVSENLLVSMTVAVCGYVSAPLIAAGIVRSYERQRDESVSA